MNRKEYQSARRLIRANGNYAMRWLSADQSRAMRRLQSQPCDRLVVRATFCAGRPVLLLAAMRHAWLHGEPFV